MKFIKGLVVAGVLLASTSSHASTLPSPEEVQGVINVCAAGRSVEVVGELNLSFKKLFSGEAKGEGKVSDLGGIIASIEDDKLKAEVYKLYLSCVMPSLLERASQLRNDDGNSQSTIHQSTSGDKSPIINTDGNITITYN